MHPAKLQRQMDTLRAVPDAGMYFTDYIWLNAPPGGKVRGPHCSIYTCFRPHLERAGERLYRLGQPDALEALMVDNYVGASTLLLRKRVWAAVGGYNGQLRAAEDLDFSLRLRGRGALTLSHSSVLHVGQQMQNPE